MGMYLKSMDAETVLAASGQECLDSVSSIPPDIILMDCQMPDMDGFEATTRLRQNGFSGVVLALTANSDEATLQRCTACGMNGHISKPVNATTLQERILSALSSDSPAAEAAPELSVADHDPLERLRGLTMAGRNTGLFNRLIASFTKSVDESIEQLRSALAANDAQGVSAAAHRIRGSAGSFGANQFAESAGMVEDKLVGLSLTETKPDAEKLLSQWGPLRSYLEKSGGTQ